MAQYKFLDQSGTSHLWNAIKTQLDLKATSSALDTLAGRVTTAEGDIDTLETNVNTLIGSDANKSVRSIAAEEVAGVVNGASTSYDTLKEIADWIEAHPASASEINAAISRINGILAGIGDTTQGQKATVKTYVDDAITALSIGDYVTATDLATELAGYMATSHPANNITSQNLTDYADAVTKKHTHANSAVLDGITAEKVTAWDTAAADSYTALTNTEIDQIIAGVDSNSGE